MRSLLVVMILAAPAGAQPIEWQAAHRFKLGLEYNSSLSEFSGPRISASYAKVQWDGSVGNGRQEFGGFLSGGFPIRDSAGVPGEEAVWLAGAAVDYALVFRPVPEVTLRAKAYAQRRESGERPDRPFVEEAPFSLYGVELEGGYRDRLELTGRVQALEVPEYPLYDHHMASLQARVTVWGNPASRLWVSGAYLRYVFDERVLVIPESQGGPGPPFPTFRDHEDDALLTAVGMDIQRSFLLSWRIFYRDYDSTIPDYRHRDFGTEGTLSLALAPRWTLSAFFRYEERDLAKSYLLFDPQILTGVGNRFLALSLMRGISEDAAIEMKAGRYANDLRLGFFGGTDPRYVVTVSLTAAF